MKKVTIMSPCYNGESHLIPHLEGILSQTYDNIEYIFINDGSTDSTEQIVNDYRSNFEERGFSLVYIKKENGGQASAINKALQVLTGEYVAQIDSDDIILPKFVEVLSGFLDNNEEYGFCVPTVAHVKEDNLNKIRKLQQRKLGKQIFDDFFFHAISEYSNMPHSSFYMYRTDLLLSVLQDGQISEKYETQIPGLYLPMAYSYKCGYLKDVLAKYVVRKNSHCRATNIIKKIQDWEGCNLEAIKRLKTDEYEKQFAYNLVKTRYIEVKKRYIN